MSDSLKNEQFSHLLFFGEQPEQIAHGRSFVMSNLSDSLTSLLTKREIANFFRKTYKKLYKNVQKIWFYSYLLSESLVFCEQKSEWAICSQKTEWFAHLLFYDEWPEWIAHSRSLVMSDLSDLLMVARLSWATWTIHSQLLICPERFERNAHSRSLKWVILSEWGMSLQYWGPNFFGWSDLQS